MPNYNVMDLAKRLSALERKILSTKQPTLNRSAIDGGAIQGMDDEGNLRTVIGEQFDGTHTVSVVTGPTPPTPTAPLLTPGLGTARTYWDGTFADGSMSPMDFRRVTVHAAPSKDFTGFDPTDQSTIIGTISTATGGEVTSALASGQEYVVQLFAWSQAGKFSQGSMAATVAPEGVDTAEIEAALAEQAKLLEANKVAAEKLVTDTKIELEAADLKLQGMISGVEPANMDAINAALEESRQAVAAAQAEVDAAETAITENSRLVAAVRADVLAATDAASGASQKATDAINSANGKNSITRSLNAPVAGDLTGRVDGDVWWRLDSYAANNVIGQWMVSGGAWVMQQIKSDVIANLDVSKLTATTASMDLVAATKMVGDFGAFKLLTADKLVVGSGANLVADPQFAAPDAWSPQAGWGVGTTGGRTSPTCLVRTAGAAGLAIFAKDTPAWLIPVTPGQYRASAWVRASADTETAQVFIAGRASAVAPQASYVGTPRAGSNVTPNTTWQRLTWVLTIPEGNSWLRLLIQATGINSTDWAFSDLSVRPMASGELIVDGAVTANSLAASAVTAGKIAANAITADKILADAITADKILADSFFANKVSGVIGTFKDVFSGSITTEMLNVTGSGKFSELVVSGMATFPSVWAGKIRGDYLSFDEGFFQKLKAGVAEFKSVTAGMITTNEIAAEAITSGKISAGAVDAGKIAANAVTSDTIAADAIDGKVMQGGDIYSPAKLLYPQVHVGGGVVEVIRNTPDDGPVATISLGGLTDSVQIIDPATGSTLSSLNPDGTISSKGVSIDGDVLIRGRSIADLVDTGDRAPQGIVAAYNLPGNSLQAGNTPLGIAEVNWVARAGRMYKIVWDGYLNAPANDRVQLLFRMKIGTLERGASAPGVNDDSTIPASGIYSAPNAGLYRSHLEAVYLGLPGSDYQARVLLSMVNLSSNSPIYASGYGSTIYVEDMGIGSFSGGYSASGGGTPYAASSADTTTAAPVAPPRTYTTTWGATWMTSQRTDGAAVSDALQQGLYAPNYRRSAIGFNTDPSSAGSIYKALAGASIQKVELYLKNSTFYSSSGGNANVDMSTLSSAPSSIGAIAGRGLARNFKFAVGEGKWVTLNSDTWAGLKDGSTRSVVLGTTAGAADYARFSKADPPKIRITYVR